MKWLLTFLLVAGIILAAYPFLQDDNKQQSLTGLPWQIDTLDDGYTRVFNLQPGKSTLKQASQEFGDDMELAIVVQGQDAGSLEMYYGHYRVGLLGGKMVFAAGTDQAMLAQWRENAVGFEYMATGNAKKYYVSANDLDQALDSTIFSITFIPSVNLDEEVVTARFGTPDQRVVSGTVVHYLYPEKGLAIAISEDTRDVLQYVQPADFSSLSVPVE